MLYMCQVVHVSGKCIAQINIYQMIKCALQTIKANKKNILIIELNIYL